MTTMSLRGRPGGFSTSAKPLSLLGRVKRVGQYRRILELLVRRDLKVRYAGSALGYLWTVLDPLLMSLVFWFVFSEIFVRKVAYQPYILYLVLGQIMWAWFNGGTTTAMRALRSGASMVRSTNVPREVWVVRVVISKGVEYVFSLPVVAIFALAYWHKPNINILFLPLAMFMCAMLVLSLGLILAPLIVLYRDIDRVVPIILRLLFYCSPIIYGLNNVPKHLSGFFHFNPTVGFLCLGRAGFFAEELRWNYVLSSAIITAVFFVIGVFTFTRLERQVLKEI